MKQNVSLIPRQSPPHLVTPSPSHLLILLLYTALSLVYTWPLARRIITHMPGDGGDDPALAWNLWWIKHRLIDQVNLDVFHADYMFYPIEINLAFYTLTPLNGLLSVPLQTALNLLLANNLILLSSFVLGGYGVFLLTAYLLRRIPLYQEIPAARLTFIAGAAGIFYAFASAKLFYPALGQFNIASSQWIPFCALYLMQMVHAPTPARRYRAAALAGLFLIFQAWAELTYASFLLIFAALLFVWWLTWLAVQNRPLDLRAFAPKLRAWLLSGLILGGVFAAGMTPFLAAMLPDLGVEGDFFGMGGGFADIFSADLMGYLAPTMLHPWLGEWARTLPFPNDKGQQIYIGYTLLALSVLGAWTLLRRGATTTRWPGLLWTSSALLFFLLTLGPQFRWAGADLPITGPFEWVSRLPFFSGNRYPSRYSVMLLLSVSVLAAYGLAWLSKDTGRREDRRMKDEALLWRRLILHPSSLILVIVLLFSLEHLSIPLPLNDARVPAIYTTLAQQPGDFAVLELPTGWRNGARIVGRQDELIMMQQWYQTVHEKRRLGGNTSRNPQYKFQYFTDAPLIGDLIALMNADRDHIAAVVEPQLQSLIDHHRLDAGQILHDLGVRYVLLHTEAHRMPPALQHFVAEALPLTLIDTWEGNDWTGQPAGIHLYAVQEPSASPDTTRRIDLHASQGNLYLAEGWSTRYNGAAPIRLAHRTPIDLLLPSPPAASPARAYQIVLDPRFTPTQGLSLDWNGARLESWTLDDGVLTFAPPPHNQGPTAIQRLTLHLEHGLLAHDAQFVHAQPGVIGTTGVSVNPGVSLLARSAGEEVGDFAQIIVNGHDAARNGRGYNLVALTPDGEVLDTAVFDTHADPAASDHLIAWLAQWREQPASHIVIAGAVADEASRLLSAEAAAALSELGVRHDLRGHLRWSHAFVGVVGAEANTALEALDLTAPAAVGIGLPLEGPVTFGAVEALILP